jgi:formate dehydrogenase maturation protein FdhE
MGTGRLATDDEIDMDALGNCPACRTGDLVTIVMTVGGRELSFTACHFCEAKWWEQDGTRVPLSSVLDLVAER